MEIITEVNKYVDVAYLIAFMAVTYSAKGWVNSLFEYLTKTRIKKHHFAVFIIGTIVAIPFWLGAFGEEHNRMQLFMTYCIGTALHSHLISYVIGKFRNATPKP